MSTIVAAGFGAKTPWFRRPVQPKLKGMKKLLQVLVLGASLGFLVGCDNNEGPLEEAGEKVDEAAKDTKRAVKDATD